MRNTKEEIRLYVNEKAKRREYLRKIDTKIEREGGNRNSVIWELIFKGMDEDGR